MSYITYYMTHFEMYVSVIESPTPTLANAIVAHQAHGRHGRALESSWPARAGLVLRERVEVEVPRPHIERPLPLRSCCSEPLGDARRFCSRLGDAVERALLARMRPGPVTVLSAGEGA